MTSYKDLKIIGGGGGTNPLVEGGGLNPDFYVFIAFLPTNVFKKIKIFARGNFGAAFWSMVEWSPLPGRSVPDDYG